MSFNGRCPLIPNGGCFHYAPRLFPPHLIHDSFCFNSSNPDVLSSPTPLRSDSLQIYFLPTCFHLLLILDALLILFFFPLQGQLLLKRRHSDLIFPGARESVPDAGDRTRLRVRTGTPWNRELVKDRFCPLHVAY